MWSQLRPFSVGFDNLFNQIDNVNAIHKQESYPPYNIRKVSEEEFVIEMAVAGFSKKDIAVEHQENVLTVKSVPNDDDADDEYVHRGISKRNFTRTFTVADDVIVKGAKMKDGMLSVELERIIPEEKKLKVIDIK
jgi:molecular chaperone IbpA|tara:strand:- start:43944 stop:44348 length:405 start_codon:yes stop_codon:yes gene_type:complete